jgi:hypothetical protein
MALAIDGSGATGIGAAGASLSATITTLLPNDIIIALVHTENPPGFSTVNSVSGGGLTWTRRTQFQHTPTAPSVIEIWWASATSALSAQTITATLSRTTDGSSMHLVAVNGATNPAIPWDTNASLPATQFGATGTPSRSISTTVSSTMVLGFFGSSSSNNSSAGPGFTNLYTTANNSAPLNWDYTRSQYRLFATAQTGTAVAFGSAAIQWGVVFDAVAADAVAGASQQARAMVLA